MSLSLSCSLFLSSLFLCSFLPLFPRRVPCASERRELYSASFFPRFSRERERERRGEGELFDDVSAFSRFLFREREGERKGVVEVNWMMQRECVTVLSRGYLSFFMRRCSRRWY